jgi:DNA replication licensing factor MCM6
LILTRNITSQENILMAVEAQPAEGEAAAAADGGEGSSARAAKVVYVLHPNCAVEEY